jgi:hypothetical protein
MAYSAAPSLSRRVFDKYDTDKSGSIRPEEFKFLCYDLGHHLSEAGTSCYFDFDNYQ